MPQETYGARKFLLDMLMKERSLDREALDECSKLRETERLTFAEVLVSEGVVTDQELGHILEKFAEEGHISPAELNLLTSEFPSSWERWKEMEERDDEAEQKMLEQDRADTEALPEIPLDAAIDQPEGEDGQSGGKKGRPLTERVHRGSLQEALEELMDDAPVKEFPSSRIKPVQEVETGDSFIGKTVGGAKVLSKLRDDQLGTVYRGLIESLNREVSIRLIKPESINPGRRKRIVEHAQNATKVEHRNVAEIITADEEPEGIYIVSRYVQGESLRERLSKDGRIPQEEALEIGLQVGRALRAGHDVEIYHGDLNPRNIILDDSGQAVVADFGLLKSTEIDREADSSQSLLMGTPQYMAPEQFDAKPADARTDMYTLGVLLYEMLSGMLPFDGSTPFAIRDAHEKGSPKSITEIDRELNSTVAKLVNKMISREPENRYQNMNDVINDLVDLKQYLATGGEAPPIARTDSTGAAEVDDHVRERANKYKTVMFTPEIKKKKKIKGIYVLITIILIVAVGGGAYIFITKPNVFKLSANFEEEADKEFEEISRGADLLLSQQNHLGALQKLDMFPSKYASSQARRKLESYRLTIFAAAKSNYEEQKGRIEEVYKSERINDARRMLRALKAQVSRIVHEYGGRWPQAAALDEYVTFATALEGEITETLKKLENFEEDIKFAEGLLKEDRLADAQQAVEKYLKSPIAKHRKEALRIVKIVEEKQKAFDLENAKKRELVEFEKAIDMARASMKAVAQLSNFKSDAGKFLKIMQAAQESFLNELFEGMDEFEESVDILEERLNASGKSGLFDPVFEQMKEFRAAMQDSRNNLEKTERDEESEGRTWWKTVIGSLEKLGENTRELVKAAESVRFDAEAGLLDDAKTRVQAYISTVDQYERAVRALQANAIEDYVKAVGEIRALAQSENHKMIIAATFVNVFDGAKSEIESGSVEEVAKFLDSVRNAERQRIKIEAGLVLADIINMLDAFEEEKGELDRRKKFASQIVAMFEMIKEGKSEDALRFVATFKDPKNPNKYKQLSEQEKEELAKVKAEAEHQIKFIEDMKRIDELIEKKEFDTARRLCLGWRYDSRKKISAKAEQKYYEIMDKKEPDMIFIEGGTAELGSDNEDDKDPKRRQIYRNFYIDRHEVTCGAYERFVKDKKYSPPRNWPRGMMPRQWMRLPVTGITWKDAAAYAKWVGKRLPTDSEWEIAASWGGKTKVLFPWGDEFDPDKTNVATGELVEIEKTKSDKSPNGVFDMGGNAAEWTATKLGSGIIVRGSSAEKTAVSEDARTTRRIEREPNTSSDFLGFRCAKDVK